MSENRLLQGKTSNATSEQPSPEAQLRQALEQMGGRRQASPMPSTPNRPHAPATAQRHRYVRDGEVPVVHAALGRNASRSDQAVLQDKSLIDSLRQELERERAHRESAERALTEARGALTVLQTRLAHLEMSIKAAEEQAAAQQAVTQQLQAQLAAQQATRSEEPAKEPAAASASRKPRVIKPRVAIVSDEPEPEPVKWWIRTAKA